MERGDTGPSVKIWENADLKKLELEREARVARESEPNNADAATDSDSKEASRIRQSAANYKPPKSRRHEEPTPNVWTAPAPMKKDCAKLEL